MTCKCVLAKFSEVFPVCKKPFNPDHPIREHRGAACANHLDGSGKNLCGHEEPCHDQIESDMSNTRAA